MGASPRMTLEGQLEAAASEPAATGSAATKILSNSVERVLDDGQPNGVQQAVPSSRPLCKVHGAALLGVQVAMPSHSVHRTQGGRGGLNYGVLKRLELRSFGWPRISWKRNGNSAL